MNKLSEADLLRKRAETKVKMMQAKAGHDSIVADNMKLLHELQVHQIELELQNEELQHVKNMAEEAKKELPALYYFAPVGYFTLCSDGKICELNLIGARMIGKERSMLVKNSFRQFVTSDTQLVFDDFFQRVFKTNTKQTCEVKLTFNRDASIHVILEGIASVFTEKRCLLVAVDITLKKATEVKLQLSEEKYSKVFHLNPSVCSLSDIDNDQYLEVNDAFTNLFGFSQDEVIGKTPPELGMAFLSTKEYLLSEMDANGRISNVEVKIKASDGELKTVIFNAENIIVNNKVCRYAVATDISERKHIEEKLIHSQERLMALSDASFEALFFSENGLGLDQNQTAERLFGYTHEEIVGKPGTELVIPNDRKKVKHNMLSFRENPYEVTALRKDGTTFPAEIQARMIFYGGRNIRVTALRDISQRKQIEQELVASESRLTQIAANSRVVIWEVDAKGIFTFVSPVAETVFGFRPDEMVNRMSFLDLYPLDGREETTKKAMEVFERKVEFFNLEGVALSKDDGRLWVSMSGMPILNADGTLKGYRGSSIDITKRKQQALEISNKMEEIKNYQTKLQKLNYTLINAEERERIRFAGFLHDSLGQILSITRIKLTTLLEDHLLNPEAVKSIKESSKLLSEAIHQCRDETYELNPPILKGFGLISALNWKLDHLKEHFSINSTLEANTENLHLKDMLNILLFRITGELINNSIKHANATQINLRIMKNDKEIIISVCDDGKGFMYDPGYSFSQNDSFGLFSISERLRAIGGKLIIDSSPGKGTKASVILSV